MKRGAGLSLARAHLIINVNLSHLWLHLLLHLALELLILLLLQYRRADLLNAGRGDKLGQLERIFSTPRFPMRNLRFCAQCFGTGIVLRYDLRWTSKRGSSAVTSHDSTTSGVLTSCLSSAIDSRLARFLARFESSFSPSSGFSAPNRASAAAFARAFAAAASDASASSIAAFSRLETRSSAAANLPKTGKLGERGILEIVALGGDVLDDDALGRGRRRGTGC